MSTRITKQIGYFLNKNQLKSFLKPNYSDILENLDYDDNSIEQFKIDLFNLMENYGTQSTSPDAERDSLMFSYYKGNKDYSWKPLELISTIMNCDSYKGILFRTPDLLKKEHFDDDIDYYENTHYKFKAKILKQPLYPTSGFLYKSNENKQIEKLLTRYLPDKKISRGLIVDSQVMTSVLYILYQKSFGSSLVYKAIRETKVFHPNVEPLVYLIAKASGILLDYVDEITFRTTVEPAIITTWG